MATWLVLILSPALPGAKCGLLGFLCAAGGVEGRVLDSGQHAVLTITSPLPGGYRLWCPLRPGPLRLGLSVYALSFGGRWAFLALPLSGGGGSGGGSWWPGVALPPGPLDLAPPGRVQFIFTPACHPGNTSLCHRRRILGSCP